jgi:hypothetical protein
MLNSAYQTLWVILLSSPAGNSLVGNSSSGLKHPQQLPFLFTGGLGFTPLSTGIAVSFLGIFGIIIQLVLYPDLSDRLSTVAFFRLSTSLFPLGYLVTPYLVLIGPSFSSTTSTRVLDCLTWVGVTLVVLFHMLARAFAIPASLILLNRCARDGSVRGKVHGICQTVSASSRAMGAAAAGAWYVIGLERGMMGTAWWAVSAVSALGSVAGFWLG